DVAVLPDHDIADRPQRQVGPARHVRDVLRLVPVQAVRMVVAVVLSQQAVQFRAVAGGESRVELPILARQPLVRRYGIHGSLGANIVPPRTSVARRIQQYTNILPVATLVGTQGLARFSGQPTRGLATGGEMTEAAEERLESSQGR